MKTGYKKLDRLIKGFVPGSLYVLEGKQERKTIKKIGKEMVKQNNRATRFVMFAIQVDEKVYGDQGTETERNYDCDGDLMCPDCIKLVDDSDVLPEYCENCDAEAFHWYSIEKVLTVRDCGVFFTAKACQDHIDANHYHYSNPKVYGIGSWRNPEMQLVQKEIIKQAGEKVPSQYE